VPADGRHDVGVIVGQDEIRFGRLRLLNKKGNRGILSQART